MSGELARLKEENARLRAYVEWRDRRDRLFDTILITVGLTIGFGALAVSLILTLTGPTLP